MDYQQAVDYIESPALPRGRYGLDVSHPCVDYIAGHKL